MTVRRRTLRACVLNKLVLGLQRGLTLGDIARFFLIHEMEHGHQSVAELQTAGAFIVEND